jgi:hypothetical protein
MDNVDKVVSINRDMFLGSYIDAQNREHIPEVLVFAVGVISTVGLPQFILSVYGGITVLLALAGSTLIAAITGLVIYRHTPYEMPHCFDVVSAAKSPPHKENRLAVRRAS